MVLVYALISHNVITPKQGAICIYLHNFTKQIKWSQTYCLRSIYTFAKNFGWIQGPVFLFSMHKSSVKYYRWQLHWPSRDLDPMTPKWPCLGLQTYCFINISGSFYHSQRLLLKQFIKHVVISVVLLMLFFFIIFSSFLPEFWFSRANLSAVYLFTPHFPLLLWSSRFVLLLRSFYEPLFVLSIDCNVNVCLLIDFSVITVVIKKCEY